MHCNTIMKLVSMLNRKGFPVLPIHQKNKYSAQKSEGALEDKFGTAVNPLTKEKEQIRRFTLKNENQMSVQIITLGATVTSIKVPDANGCIEDICLGYDNAAGFGSKTNPYFGAICGRVCNRLGNARFMLNGREINVSKNDGNHSLHGGFIGFDKVHWEVVDIGKDSVTMEHCSPDGHEGYPGEVTATVCFTLTQDNRLKLEMKATTTEVTAVSLTNHCYFNLAGHASGAEGLYEHLMLINADKITERDLDGISTGCFTEVKGSVFDFRTISNLGERLKKIKSATGYEGYDHTFCVKLKGNGLSKIARALHPKTGRWMEVFCDQPGVHFYSGQYMGLAGPITGKGGTNYTKHGAFCLETGQYPDALNHEHFPSVILCPHLKYSHNLDLKFGVCDVA